MTAEKVGLYGDPDHPYHDSTCRCSRHCRNCGYGLEGRQRKYCSDYCGRVWRAELELDEILRSATIPLPQVS